MTHYMKLNNDSYILIKSGKKDIELRLYDEKRQKIFSGDYIVFTNIKNGEELKVTVLQLHIYKNFKELYEKFDKIRIGYNESEIAEPIDMKKYYSKEDIEKYGVVGIEIKIS